MGVVYKAYDPELERPVALKLLHAGPRSADDAERRSARLLREAKALARLQHPNVVAVHDVGTFEGDVFLATEFVEGAPLRSWILTEKPAMAEILRVMIAAGEGLAAAHRAGLIHRDVSRATSTWARTGACGCSTSASRAPTSRRTRRPIPSRPRPARRARAPSTRR